MNSEQRIPALDGMRGLAILCVLSVHLYAPASTKLMHVVKAGWVGVDLFFALSGFLITGILLRMRQQPDYYRRFYVRRAQRIFPVYYLALTVGLVVLPTTAGVLRLRELQAWYWTYTANVAQGIYGDEGMPAHWSLFWSLAVEEQFYLIWPLVVRRASLQTLSRVCVAGSLAVWVLRPVIFWSGGATAFVYSQLFTRADELLLGALVAILAFEGRQLSPGCSRLTLAAGLVGLIGIGAWQGDLNVSPVVLSLGLPCVALVCFGTLGLCVNGRAPFLETSLLTFWAPYAYGLYVWHRIVTDAVTWPALGGHLGTFVLFSAKVAVSLVAAAASWHLFERRWLRSSQPAPPQAPPARLSMG
ncbi:MAG: acyltransferase [Vicinamibacterales bacterium]